MTPLRIALILCVAAALYQLYVTVRVAKQQKYSRSQKAYQIALIWIVPVLGAVVVHVFCVSDKEIPVHRDKAFTPQTPNDAGLMD